MVIAFVLAQGLDLLTTLAGIRLLGLYEAWEPALAVAGAVGWTGLVWGKAGVAVLIAALLQALPLRSRSVWALPVVAGLPALWNLLVIAVEVATR